MSGQSDRIGCSWIRSHLEEYLEDRVSAADRREARRHMEGCRDCFELVLTREPLELFAPLANEQVRYESRDDFWPAIREAINAAPAGASRRAWWPVAGTLRRAAAVVLAVAALGAAAGLGLLAPRQTPQAPETIAEAPPVAPEAAGEARPLPPTVEQVRTPGSREVQVYSMQYHQEQEPGAPVDAAARVTELVLIVDAGLDL